MQGDCCSRALMGKLKYLRNAGIKQSWSFACLIYRAKYSTFNMCVHFTPVNCRAPQREATNPAPYLILHLYVCMYVCMLVMLRINANYVRTACMHNHFSGGGMHTKLWAYCSYTSRYQQESASEYKCK